MADRPSFLDFGAWTAKTWATALAAGVVAFLLLLMFGAGWLIALIIGIVAFLGAAWVLAQGAAPMLSGDIGAQAPPPPPPAQPVVEPPPAAAQVPPAGAAVEPTRPAGLDAPREGGPDDLKRIKGVGPKLEALLHSLGYYHFDQIALWTPAEVAWVDSNLEGFNGRATRDDWVGQARILAGGDETEFSRRVDKGEV